MERTNKLPNCCWVCPTLMQQSCFFPLICEASTRGLPLADEIDSAHEGVVVRVHALLLEIFRAAEAHQQVAGFLAIIMGQSDPHVDRALPTARGVHRTGLHAH